MAASSIKEKLGKLIVNLTIKRFEIWSQTELEKLKQKPQPFCIEYSNRHYGIGNFDIKVQKDGSARVYNDNNFLHHFQNKQIAIYYCAYEKLHKYNSSDNLLKVDTELALARSDYDVLNFRLKHNENSTEFQKSVRLARYQEAYYRLKHAELEFKKTLTSAKYNKIWETLT